MQNNGKELKYFLGDITVYFTLPFLNNTSQYSLSMIYIHYKLYL